MNDTIPAERDLPPGRLDEMHADYVRAIAAAPGRRRPAWLAPLAAAAVVVAVIGTVALVVRTRDDGPDRAVVARPRHAVDRIGDARIKAIEQGCAASLAGSFPGAHPDPTMRLYNLIGTAERGSALLYGEQSSGVCELGSALGEYAMSGGTGGQGPDELYGPFQTDGWGNTDDPKTHVATVQAYGRATPEVATITVTVNGSGVDHTVPVVHGTFLVIFSESPKELDPEGIIVSGRRGDLTVRAFDASGRELKLTAGGPKSRWNPGSAGSSPDTATPSTSTTD